MTIVSFQTISIDNALQELKKNLKAKDLEGIQRRNRLVQVVSSRLRSSNMEYDHLYKFFEYMEIIHVSSQQGIEVNRLKKIDSAYKENKKKRFAQNELTFTSSKRIKKADLRNINHELSLNDLPQEILDHILTKLDYCDFESMLLVNKLFFDRCLVNISKFFSKPYIFKIVPKNLFNKILESHSQFIRTLDLRKRKDISFCEIEKCTNLRTLKIDRDKNQLLIDQSENFNYSKNLSIEWPVTKLVLENFNDVELTRFPQIRELKLKDTLLNWNNVPDNLVSLTYHNFYRDGEPENFAGLKRFSNLQKLSTDFCSLSTLINSSEIFPNLQKLTFGKIEYPCINIQNFTFLSFLTKLTELKLENTNFSENDFIYLPKNLKKLKIAGDENDFGLKRSTKWNTLPVNIEFLKLMFSHNDKPINIDHFTYLTKLHQIKGIKLVWNSQSMFPKLTRLENHNHIPLTNEKIIPHYLAENDNWLLKNLKELRLKGYSIKTLDNVKANSIHLIWCSILSNDLLNNSSLIYLNACSIFSDELLKKSEAVIIPSNCYISDRRNDDTISNDDS